MPTDRRLLPMLGALCAALLLACAAAPAASSAGGASHDRDVITAQELADVRVASGSVLEAVRKLRPRFLNQGSPEYKATDNGLMASINGAAPTSISDLSRMSATEVTEVRYLSIADAGFRFGLAGNNGPVLLVTLKAR